MFNKKYRISMNTETSIKSSHQRDVIVEEKIVQLSLDENKKNFVNDAAFAIQICRRFLTVLGIWIPINSGVFYWRTVLNTISIIACIYGIYLRVVPSGLYIILDEKGSTEKLRLIIRWGYVLMAALKYTFMQCHRRNIQKCMKRIELDWLELGCTASREIMLDYARFGHMLTRICAVFTYVGATLTAMLPIIAMKFLSDKTHSVNATETVSVRRFAIPSHFGFSVFSETPIYEVIYTSQIIASFMMMTMVVGCYSLAVVIVMHACGQLQILMGKLNELVDGGGEMTMYDSVDSRLSDVVSHHVKTLRFISSGEKILRQICLVDLAGNPFEMCFLGYICLLEFRSETKHPIASCAYTILLLTFIFNMFSVCYIGELLTQDCMNVGEVTYMIDWYRLQGKKSLDSSFIITMAQYPVALTAGGAFPMSMRSFATVMRTAMGYLNMLRTVMD